MSKTPPYIDIATKRQAILERLKSAEVREFSKVFKKLEKLIRKTFGSLDNEFSTLGIRQLNTLIALLRKDQGELFTAATTNFLKSAEDVAALIAAQEIIDLKKTVDFPEGKENRLKEFAKKDIFRKVKNRPLSTNGDLLGDFTKDLTRSEVNRVSKTIRLGHSQGKTNQEMIRELVGTKARNYKDGVLNVSRRHAETMVRTSVQHVASAARQEVWEANGDVVKKYRFIATLDNRTSSICRSLDNQEFDFGKGPIPPVHPNCRSTTIPVLDAKFKFLSNGRTRSSSNGPVDANQSYYDWLKKQDTNTQDMILGPTRGQLFRDGGMTAERFRDLQFDKNFVPLTLKEMEKLEPEAFEKADISL